MHKPVRFNTSKQAEFYRTLRAKVHNYFSENGISRHANFNMVLKTVFMVSLYFVPWALLIILQPSQIWINTLLWSLMGFGMSGIGMAVMHDANHGSYSKHKSVNKFLGFLVNFAGGYHVNWIIQHNVLHHSFTNIHGHDEDIEQWVMRFTPDQKASKKFRYQAYYAPFFYGLMTLYWALAKDFIQLNSYHKNGLLKKQGLSFNKALFQVSLNKLWYLGLFLFLPIYISPLAWWQTVLFFLLMHFISGLILALIFQPAHVVEDTEFFVADAENSVENNWAIHQMLTTTNFSRRSKIFTWLIGGLNYQIEHHLFPNICHIHYPKIASIVKETAKEHGIPYHEHKTFYHALKSHFKLLNSLGNGSYDKKAQVAAAS